MRYSKKALVNHMKGSEAARPFRTVWSRERGLGLHMAGVTRHWMQAAQGKGMTLSVAALFGRDNSKES